MTVAPSISEMIGRAGDTLRGLGTLLKDTVEYEGRGLLERLRVATHEDLRILASRLDALDRQLDAYAARQGDARQTGADASGAAGIPLAGRDEEAPARD